MNNVETAKFNKTGQRIDNLKIGTLGHQGDCKISTVTLLPPSAVSLAIGQIKGLPGVTILHGESGHIHGIYKINKDGEVLELTPADIEAYEITEDDMRTVFIKANVGNIALLHEEHNGQLLVPNKIYKYEQQIIPDNSILRRVQD